LNTGSEHEVEAFFCAARRAIDGVAPDLVVPLQRNSPQESAEGGSTDLDQDLVVPLQRNSPQESAEGGSTDPWTAFLSKHFPDDEKMPGCTSEIAEELLEMAAYVASKGLGEKVPAKGMLFIMGERASFAYTSLFSAGDPMLNQFRDGALQITIKMFLERKDVQTQILPCFGMDKAMIFCGRTGRILANKIGVKDISKGIDSAGTKLQAGSAIAQEGFFALKVSEDICMPGGDLDGKMQAFPGTREYVSLPKHREDACCLLQGRVQQLERELEVLKSTAASGALQIDDSACEPFKPPFRRSTD